MTELELIAILHMIDIHIGLTGFIVGMAALLVHDLIREFFYKEESK